MVSKYSSFLNDGVPAPKARDRLDYLSLETTQRQMHHAIRYLVANSLTVQAQEVNLKSNISRNFTILNCSYEEVLGLGSVVGLGVALASGISIFPLVGFASFALGRMLAIKTDLDNHY